MKESDKVSIPSELLSESFLLATEKLLNTSEPIPKRDQKLLHVSRPEPEPERDVLLLT